MSDRGQSAATGLGAEPGILRMTWPLVLSFWMRSAFMFVDTAYAATLGDDAIAAIGLTAPFEFLMVAAWVGASNGFTSRLAAAMAARENEKVIQLKRAVLTIIGGVSAAYLLVGLAAVWAADKVGLEPGLAEAFRIYAGILLCGTALNGFWTILPDSIVKAHHDTRSTMWAGIASNLTNVCLNTLFLFVFHWGIAGIALSTVLGRFAGLGYALYRSRIHERRRLAAVLEPTPGRFDRPVRAILQLSLPAAVAYVLLGLESFAVNGYLASLPDSTSALAGFSIYDRFVRLLAAPGIAASVALLPFVARRFGRGDVEGILEGSRKLSRALLLYVLFLVVPVMLFLANPLAAALCDAPGAERAAQFGLKLVPIAVFAGIPYMLARAVFEGMQRARPGLIAAVIRSVFLMLPLVVTGAWLAPRFGGEPIEGVFVGHILAAGITSMILRSQTVRASATA